MNCCSNDTHSDLQQEQIGSVSHSPTSRFFTGENRNLAGDVLFQYTGFTGLTVIGPVTGKVYRFEQKDARLLIDKQDVALMHKVPVLKRVVAV